MPYSLISVSVTADNAGIIISCSKRSLDRVLGYSIESVVGHPFESLLASPFKQLIRHCIDDSACFDRVSKKMLMMEACHRDGPLVPICCIVSRVMQGSNTDTTGNSSNGSGSVNVNVNGRKDSINSNSRLVFTFYRRFELIGRIDRREDDEQEEEEEEEFIKNISPVCLPLLGYETSELIGKSPSTLFSRPWREYNGQFTHDCVFSRSGISIPSIIQTKKNGEFRIDSWEDLQFVVLCTTDGAIVSLSASFILFFGHSARDMRRFVGTPIFKFIPELQSRFSTDSGEVGFDNVWNSDKSMVAVHKDGHEFPLDVFVSSCWKENDQTLVGVICSHPVYNASQSRVLLNYSHESHIISSDGLSTIVLDRDGGDDEEEEMEKEAKGKREHRSSTTPAHSILKPPTLSLPPLPSPIPQHVQIPHGRAKVGRWVPSRLIGQGLSSVVWMVCNSVTGQNAALKLISKKNLSDYTLSMISLEISILQSLRHEHIVKLIDYFDTPDYAAVIMELVSGGELLGLVENSETGLGESLARMYFTQMTSAVAYLHSKDIIHRDLKLSNTLLNTRMRIKLADFGAAVRAKPDMILKSFCGTVHYVAPEILLGKEYLGRPVDIWSLGVVLYALVTARFPFIDAQSIVNVDYQLHGQSSPDPSTTVTETETAAMSGRGSNSTVSADVNTSTSTGSSNGGSGSRSVNVTTTTDAPTPFSPSLRDLFQRIFVSDPKARITIDEMLEHPWILEHNENDVDFTQLGTIGVSATRQDVALYALGEHPYMNAL